jgi:hypothetical protein
MLTIIEAGVPHVAESPHFRADVTDACSSVVCLMNQPSTSDLDHSSLE